MLIFDLSFIPTFIVWLGIVLYLNIHGFIKKQSIFNAINLAICLVLIIIHMCLRDSLHSWQFSIICDLTLLAISISLYLYINDIETRRKVISEVFENKYNKKS